MKKAISVIVIGLSQLVLAQQKNAHPKLDKILLNLNNTNCIVSESSNKYLIGKIGRFYFKHSEYFIETSVKFSERTNNLIHIFDTKNDFRLLTNSDSIELKESTDGICQDYCIKSTAFYLNNFGNKSSINSVQLWNTSVDDDEMGPGNSFEKYSLTCNFIK